MQLKQLIQNYLQEIKLMQLATAIDHQPWVSSVWFATDENLAIYWISSTTRRHSSEVMKNKKVAAAFALPQKPEDPPRGLQMQGTAELLTKQEDIDRAISVFAGRIFSKEKISELMASVDKPHRFYKVTPTQFVLFDAVNFPENSRQEFNF